MKESKEFKMLNEKYLSCNGKLKQRLINFHKDILKKYLRSLRAYYPGFPESYFGLIMVSSPPVKMLNFPKIEMVYLIQPLMNTLYREKYLNTEKNHSAYQSVEAVEGQMKELLLETRRKAMPGESANLIKSFLSIYKHKYISRFMEASFYNGLKLKRNRICLDSKTSSAAKTAKSETVTRRKKIFLSRGKFHPSTTKYLVHLDHMHFSVLQESKMADTAIASLLPDQRSSSFLQRSTKIFPCSPPGRRPIPYIKRSFLRAHKFIPMLDTQHTRMKEHASFSPQFVFADRHQNSRRSFEVMRAKKDTNSRAGVKSYPTGLGSSGFTTPVQPYGDYELIADRVYDIIENRIRIEKERE